MNNDKFIAKWKPIHEKSLVRYCLKYLTKLFSFTSLITIIFLWIYPRIKNRTLSEDEMYFVITVMAITFLSSTVMRILSWFSGEKRYNRIVNKEFEY
ncbi:MAG TPA: hypothetical protein DD730_06775 [Desulfosporosinus sp.]|jgi:hypothetical protein|nr:hypothetical protein [Desulfosporosinus sp.]